MKNYIFLVSTLLFLLSLSNLKAQTTFPDSLAIAADILGLSFTESELDSMSDGVKRTTQGIKALQDYELPNRVSPALVFDPRPTGFKIEEKQQAINFDIPKNVKLPKDRDDLAFYSVAQLSALIKSKQISSVELTRFFIERLKKYGDTLKCVITITEDLALEQASKADQQIASGNYKGPLHGIPYAVKDLLAVEGYKTTWGAMPYKDQQIEGTATVVEKLDNAGAVLLAKLTLGALAMGDIWYGGVTKNPWNLEQGSSGSSAGSASATAAGLAPFTLGTETLGSIVSPSTRCGVTGLRPTFGRVSKHGAMALSWSMDKIGPITRSAEDAALVFEVIRGSDNKDLSVVDAPFNYDAEENINEFKVAYFKDLFEADYSNKKNDSLSLLEFRKLGVEPVAIELPEGMPFRSLLIILSSESAGAFDLLTRSNQDDLMVNQRKGAWPNYFRTARFVSAVDYVNANRVRSVLIEKMNNLLKDYDAVLTPSFGGSQLVITNLTGHPCVVFPNGFNEEGSPTSFSIIGNLYDEAKLLRLAKAYQEATQHDDKHPEMFD